MKTLDEVIDLFDNGCIRPCIECPCYGMKECHEQLVAESYYLHEYQKIEDEYHELKDWWAEEYVTNDPLTWDELKTLVGKPVWIEEEYYCSDEWHGHWEVISCVWDDEYDDDPYLGMTNEEYRHKSDLGERWKAYKKEVK